MAAAFSTSLPVAQRPYAGLEAVSATVALSERPAARLAGSASASAAPRHRAQMPAFVGLKTARTMVGRPQSDANRSLRRAATATHLARSQRSAAVIRCEAEGNSKVSNSVRPKDNGHVPKLDVVMKFGGSSVMNADRIKHVVEVVKTQLDMHPVVVLSAMGKTTNQLLAAGDNALKGTVNTENIRDSHYKACHDLGISTEDVDPLLSELEALLTGISLIRELSPKTKDYLVSFGERMSVRIFARFLNDKCGIPARFIDAFDLGMLTDSNFMNAEVDTETYDLIRSRMTYSRELDGDLRLPVVTGFIGKDRDGNITTLGRGGSDLTASVIGVALHMKEIQVWKDVDGIMTTDPRIVGDALPVDCVSFEEAAEMAHFGANVLHPLSIIPAMRANIPVKVKNSYDPMHPGTSIVRDRAPKDRPVITAMTMKRNVTIVDVVSTRMLGASGFLAQVFDVFRNLEISVDVVATSEISVSCTLDQKTAAAHVQQIEPAMSKFATVSVHSGKAIISLVGNVEHSSAILRKVFDTLEAIHVDCQLMSQGASKVNISFCVDDADAERTLTAIHAAFYGVRETKARIVEK
eukprot:tig00000851_g4904.t1